MILKITMKITIMLVIQVFNDNDNYKIKINNLKIIYFY